jgi:hypothetical protein
MPRQQKLDEQAAELENEQLSGSDDVENELPGDQSHRKVRPIDVWRDWVPLTVRKRVSPSVAEWARQHMPH